MQLKRFTQDGAHRDHTTTTPRLRCPKLSVGECLGDFDVPAQKVEPRPLECENLSNSHTREHCRQHNGAAWLRQPCEQGLDLCWLQRHPPLIGYTVADLYAVGWVGLQIPLLNCGPQHLRKRDADAMYRRA